MRNVIQDQVSHTFIEGPIQSQTSNNNNQQNPCAKTVNNVELNQENLFKGNADDINIPAYEVYERYD